MITSSAPQNESSPDAGRQVLTQRLFLIFIAFALIPVVALSTVAIQYISNSSRDQLKSVLVAQSDTFGDRVLSRLAVVERRLDVFRGELKSGAIPDTRGWVVRDNYGGESLRMGLFAPEFLPDDVQEDQLRHLRAGRVLLVVKLVDVDLEEVYLVQAVEPLSLEEGLAVAALDALSMFGDPETRNLLQENCIYDAEGHVLFATSIAVCESFGRINQNYRGEKRATIDDVAYTLTYRSLFLSENFRAGDWRAGIVNPDAEALREYELFRNSFLAFAGLALFMLSLVSVRLIRRQMAPLGAIMDGIRRVSAREYDKPVVVDSGDEFEAMAGAFNSMSQRVSRQLATMGSMSEIDQLILARGKKEDIARIVLAKTRSVLPGDHFALFLLGGEDDTQQGSLYRQEGREGADVVVSPAAIDDRDCKLLEALSDTRFEADDERLPAFVQALRRDSDRLYHLLPVLLDGRLIAVLVIAFSTPDGLDDEQRELAASFADRVAVGLSNAEWEAKLFHQANYDSLTDLPNRLALIEELGRRVARAKRENAHFAVIFIDLDNFKLINDSMGHDRGDQLIVAMGERMKDCLRSDDMIARLGGDEFIIVCSEAPDEGWATAWVNEVASRVLSVVKRPLMLDEQEVRVEASMGVALFPGDGEDTGTLMRNADSAMYHAKAKGRGSYQFFSDDLNREAAELMVLSTELKQAIERDEFVLFFQPKVSASSYQIVGAEALIRWQHPSRGLLPPGAFMQAAETLGLMEDLGDWVLDAACDQLRTWKAAGQTVVPISVNVVASQIQKQSMVNDLLARIAQYGVASSELELEITEDALVSDIQSAVPVLEQLRAAGITVSIDDFGTGYSSLGYMKQLPVDKLKIDRTFIIDLARNTVDQAIVTSTILLADSVGMTVVAEGVEDEEQLAWLRDRGCDEIQGFYFSPPVPADEFMALVAAGPFPGKR